MLKKIVDFILVSHIFIAVCAVALCIETNLLLQLPLNPYSFYLFVFGATLLQYNLPHVVKKKDFIYLPRLKQEPRYRIFLIMTGIICITIGLLHFQLHHFTVLAVMAIIASLYSIPALPFWPKRLKDYGLLKISILTIEWTLVTVWLPVSEIQETATLFWLIFIRRFVFMFILCLLFDIRDTLPDGRENINTIPVRFGHEKSYQLSDLLLILFIILSILHLVITSNFWQFLAMFLSAILLKIIVEHSKKSTSQYLYIAVVDGMMLIQAGLIALSTFL